MASINIPMTPQLKTFREQYQSIRRVYHLAKHWVDTLGLRCRTEVKGVFDKKASEMGEEELRRWFRQSKSRSCLRICMHKDDEAKFLASPDNVAHLYNMTVYFLLCPGGKVNMKLSSGLLERDRTYKPRQDGTYNFTACLNAIREAKVKYSARMDKTRVKRLQYERKQERVDHLAEEMRSLGVSLHTKASFKKVGDRIALLYAQPQDDDPFADPNKPQDDRRKVCVVEPCGNPRLPYHDAGYVIRSLYTVFTREELTVVLQTLDDLLRARQKGAGYPVRHKGDPTETCPVPEALAAAEAGKGGA